MKEPWIKQLMTLIGLIIFVWLAVLGEAVLGYFEWQSSKVEVCSPNAENTGHMGGQQDYNMRWDGCGEAANTDSSQKFF